MAQYRREGRRARRSQLRKITQLHRVRQCGVPLDVRGGSAFLLTLTIWWEWEQASEGRRQLTWSTGARDLRKVAGLGAEATDEDVAAEELEADTRLGLSTDAWDYVARAHLGPELLAAAENGGLDAARARLDAKGLSWTTDGCPSTRRPRPRRPTQPATDCAYNGKSEKR